jgi:hypothetical protein
MHELMDAHIKLPIQLLQGSWFSECNLKLCTQFWNLYNVGSRQKSTKA